MAEILSQQDAVTKEPRTVAGLFQEQDSVAVEPFTAVALELGGSWAEVEES